MADLIFTSTSETPEQMAADLEVAIPTPAAAPSTPSTTAATPAASTEPTTPTTPAPAPSAPAGDTPADASDDEDPLEGFDPAERARLADKTQRRIAKLVKERRTSEAERDALRAERDALRQRMTAPGSPAPTDAPSTPPAPTVTPSSTATPIDQWTPPGYPPRPTLESCDYDGDAHMDAVVQWSTQLALARHAEGQRREGEAASMRAVQQAEQARVDQFRERLDAVVAAHEDYETVTAIPLPAVSPDQAAFFEYAIGRITDSQGQLIGPELLYHLGQHRDDLTRILRDSPGPFELNLALARIAMQVEAQRSAAPVAPAPAPSPRPKTKAPAPLQAAQGLSATPTDDLDDPTISQAEWERRYEAQRRRTGGGGS